MAPNLYGEIREDLKIVADILEDKGYTYKVYNNGIQFNVEDKNGIIQTFYPTTGTIVFHRSNERKDNVTHSIKDSDLYTFMDYLDHPEEIQELFK